MFERNYKLIFWGIIFVFAFTGCHKKVPTANKEAKREAVAEVLKRLRSGENLNQKDSSGFTWLHRASQEGSQEYVEALLIAKANINAIHEESGSTPLFLASEWGQTEIVKLLLEAKADVDLSDSGGHTPIFKAAQKGHENIVRLLIKAKADVDISRNDDSMTPLIIASIFGHTNVVEALLEAGADVHAKAHLPKGDCTALHLAEGEGHVEIIMLLKEYMAQKSN